MDECLGDVTKDNSNICNIVQLRQQMMLSPELDYFIIISVVTGQLPAAAAVIEVTEAASAAAAVETAAGCWLVLNSSKFAVRFIEVVKDVQTFILIYYNHISSYKLVDILIC